MEERYQDCRMTAFDYKGHEMITLENKTLRTTVMVDQGADLTELRHKATDVDVLWHAPQRILPSGKGMPPTYREQGNFLDHLHGGWQEVLPNGHLNCFYKGASLGQHGEVSLLPWSYRTEKDTPEEIKLSLSVQTRRTPLRLERSMSLQQESGKLVMEETVLNEGNEDMDFMWGHHPCYGAPFIGENCRIVLPKGTIIHIPTFNTGANRRYAAGFTGAWPHVPAAGNGAFLRADLLPSMAEGTDDSFYMEVPEGWYEIHNPQLGIGVRMEWDSEVFPYVWCWQVFGGAFGYPYYGRTYNLALEPFSSPIATLADCVEHNLRRLALQSGESISTRLSIEFISF